jgi:hypothetical protein
VYNPDGTKIGDWPPFASYPASPIDLAKPVAVWVRLTFRTASNETAIAYRKMTCPLTGAATVDVQVDPAPARAATDRNRPSHASPTGSYWLWRQEPNALWRRQGANRPR